MKQIVAVDPGLNACGVSIWNENGRLEHAALIENERTASVDLMTRWEGAALAVAEYLAARSSSFPHYERTLIVEMPKIYPAARQKGDQNDLINLAGVVVSIGMFIPAAGRRLLYPRDWKGTIDPDEMIEKRIKPRLGPEEHRRVCLPSAASKAHNVWDGIGIGLHVLGRLEPRKVIAR